MSAARRTLETKTTAGCTPPLTVLSMSRYVLRLFLWDEYIKLCWLNGIVMLYVLVELDTGYTQGLFLVVLFTSCIAFCFQKLNEFACFSFLVHYVKVLKQDSHFVKAEQDNWKPSASKICYNPLKTWSTVVNNSFDSIVILNLRHRWARHNVNLVAGR